MFNEDYLDLGNDMYMCRRTGNIIHHRGGFPMPIITNNKGVQKNMSNVKAENTLRQIFKEKQNEENGHSLVNTVVKSILTHLEVDYSSYTIDSLSKKQFGFFVKRIKYSAKICVARPTAFSSDYARLIVQTDLKNEILSIDLYMLEYDEHTIEGKLYGTMDPKEIKKLILEGKLTK